MGSVFQNSLFHITPGLRNYYPNVNYVHKKSCLVQTAFFLNWGIEYIFSNLNYLATPFGIPLLADVGMPLVATGMGLEGSFTNSGNFTFSFAAKLSS